MRCASAGDLGAWRKLATWNRNYYPYFWREVWPILSRPNDYQYVMDFDAFTGGDPHENARGSGGNMDPDKISIPPFNGENPDNKQTRYQSRRFIWRVVRRPGGENSLTNTTSKLRPGPFHYAMPYVCGNNCLSNTAASKFLRLTDTQLFILKQWAEGKFINEKLEEMPPAARSARRRFRPRRLGQPAGWCVLPGR